ncbi:MAG: type II secretion system protein GspN, partial [Myxococcales bacterium]|nr:type II secretion system protein GspN [Myxococcales bacterium]
MNALTDKIAPLGQRISGGWTRVRQTRMGRWLPWIGSASYFLFFFLLFAYLTFPYDRLRDWIIEQVEYSEGPGGTRIPSGYELEIVSLEPSWFTGIEAHGVRLVKAAEGPEERPLDVTFEELHARVSVLPLLIGDIALSFGGRVGGGEVDGEFEASGEALALRAKIAHVHLRRIPILRILVGLPFSGQVDGEVDLAIEEDRSQSEGTLGLRIAELEVGDGSAKFALDGMRDGLTIEKFAAGDLELEIALEEGIG